MFSKARIFRKRLPVKTLDTEGLENREAKHVDIGNDFHFPLPTYDFQNGQPLGSNSII